MYGYDTRSWRNSTEKRQMDKERREVTRKYEAGELRIKSLPLEPLCSCRSFRHSHTLAAHRLLKSEMDWRTAEERRDTWEEWRKAI